LAATGPGSHPGPLLFRAVYWAMPTVWCRLLALCLPAAALAQGAVRAPAYRGFAPGVPYGEFAERARALAERDALVCTTSHRTARLMECGEAVRDPADGARFYLSAFVLEGRIAMVALYDSAGFGDGDGAALVERRQRDLVRRFGRPRVVGQARSGWEWRYGRQVVRLSWRARGPARWVSITLTDNDVMDRIARYAARRAPPSASGPAARSRRSASSATPRAFPSCSSQRGGMAPSPSRAPSSAPATAAFVSVSPPASARKISASSSDGRCTPHQKAISTQCTT